LTTTNGLVAQAAEPVTSGFRIAQTENLNPVALRQPTGQVLQGRNSPMTGITAEAWDDESNMH
jgi:hypothetical protein